MSIETSLCKKEKEFIVAAVLQVTLRCNLACKHCYLDCSPEARLEIDIRDCSAIIDSLANCGITTLSISGGEPFMHSSLREIVLACKRNNIKVKVNTNGMLLRPDLLRSYNPNDFFDIRVSLDGNRAQHDDLRGQGVFRHVIQGIRDAVKDGFLLSTSTVDIGEHNNVFEAIQAAQASGIRHMHVYSASFEGRGGEFFITKQQDCRLDEQRSLPERVYKFSPSVCPYGFSPAFLIIRANGEVNIGGKSHSLKARSQSFGNALEANGIGRAIEHAGYFVADCRTCIFWGKQECPILHNYCSEDYCVKSR